MWKASYDDDIREARAEGIDELKEQIKTLERENRIKLGAWKCEVEKLKKLEAWRDEVLQWKYELFQTAKVMDWDLPEEVEDDDEYNECMYQCCAGEEQEDA